MRCTLLTHDGELVTEGAGGIRRDGGIELVVLRSERRLRPGDGPYLLAEGPRCYPVIVQDVHGSRDEARTGPLEIYHLRPLVDA